METVTPKALGGYHYPGYFEDAATRRGRIQVLKNKSNAVAPSNIT